MAAQPDNDLFGFAKDEIYRVVEALAGADPSGNTTIETEDLPGGQQHILRPSNGRPPILVVVLQGATILEPRFAPGRLGAVEPRLIDYGQDRSTEAVAFQPVLTRRQRLGCTHPEGTPCLGAVHPRISESGAPAPVDILEQQAINEQREGVADYYRERDRIDEDGDGSDEEDGL